MRAIACLALALAACGDHASKGVPDAPRPDANPVITECHCDPLYQFGCNAGDKCTWVLTSFTPSQGVVSCAPDGTAAIGEPCTYSRLAAEPACSGGVTDNCAAGGVCTAVMGGPGTCKKVCSTLGGEPMCGSGEACVPVPGLFQYGSASPAFGGVCVPQCDPLADNDVLGSGVRGSGCADGLGCYGLPSFGTPPVTAFACMPEGDRTLVHRTVAPSWEANACAEGYEPIVHEATGSTSIACVALCMPGDTYLGGPQQPIGIAPHRCATSDARGTFGAHEHCMYLWRLEQDGSGNLLPSEHSDTLGVCIDHAQYRYDSNHDGVIDGSDATWPDCATLPLSGSDVVAADFGCVSTTTAPALPATPAPGL